jgi:hypothetical protein
LRLQTHDSITGVVDTSHPDWQEGVRRFFHVMQRPTVCKGRVVKMGIEADVSVNWAHHTAVVKNVADVTRWAGNAGLL